VEPEDRAGNTARIYWHYCTRYPCDRIAFGVDKIKMQKAKSPFVFGVSCAERSTVKAYG